MKKFLQNIIILILPFAIFIASINFFIDPAYVFSNGNYEKRVGEILLKGHNIDYLKNFDERLALKNLITQLPYTPNIVSIGSSRSLQMSSNFFPRKSFINCSLSHATIKDIVAVVGLLDSSKKLPAEIYLETSTIITNTLASDEWQSIFQYYLYGLKNMNIENEDNNLNPQFELFKKKCTALFSFAYFQNSILKIKKKKQNVLKDVDTQIPQNFGRLFDFSVAFPREYQTRDTIKAISDAVIFTSKTSPPKINIDNLNTIKKILVYLKSKGVKVTLLNLPFQPDCYRIYDKKKEVFKELQSGIKKFATEMELPLIGTFNPNDANLNRRNFWDQLHCDKPSLMTVMKIVQYNPN
jgi:hypothetical protein